MTYEVFFWSSECVFPAVSPIVDDKVHIILQEDYTPGTGSGEVCYIDYLNFPKAFFVGIPEPAAPSGLSVSKNYPNPARQSTHFELRMEKPAFVSVNILDIAGHVVKRMNLGRMDAGAHTIALDLSGLPKGMYTFCIDAGGERATGKMVVE
jgi:hypothetical protein